MQGTAYLCFSPDPYINGEARGAFYYFSEYLLLLPPCPLAAHTQLPFYIQSTHMVFFNEKSENQSKLAFSVSSQFYSRRYWI